MCRAYAKLEYGLSCCSPLPFSFRSTRPSLTENARLAGDGTRHLPRPLFAGLEIRRDARPARGVATPSGSALGARDPAAVVALVREPSRRRPPWRHDRVPARAQRIV